MVKFFTTIHAERGVTQEQIDAAALGMEATVRQTGLPYHVNVVHEPMLFPTLPSGQVSSEVISGHPRWDGGLNLWLTSRDMRSYDGSTNFIYGVGGPDGHMAVSAHRLDRQSKDNPLNLLTTVAHETGHTLGLVNETATRHSARYGFSGHCLNDCTMEASNGLTDTLRTQERLLNNIGTAGFCVECLGDLLNVGRAINR